MTWNDIWNGAKELPFWAFSIRAVLYAQMSQQITEPNMQNMFKGMEMAARNNYKSISQKMSEMAIV